MLIDAQGLLIVIVVGVVAGWIGAVSDGTSAIGHLVTGVIGAYLAIYVSATFNVPMPTDDPLLTQVVAAIVGASLALAISRYFFSRA